MAFQVRGMDSQAGSMGYGILSSGTVLPMLPLTNVLSVGQMGHMRLA